MLTELHISNLAVIEDASVEFGPGLNVFTGGTGAGKSLVLGALEGLLGLRKVGGMLRDGAKEGRISGVFRFTDASVAAAIAAALDIDIALDEEVLITRKIHASGRTSVSVNGRPATSAMLKAAAEHVVDIHGQHDHQFLLKPANQLAILDACAGSEELRRRYGEAWSELRRLQERRDALNASADLREQRLDLYRFQVAEIDAVEPREGELDRLEARERALSSVESLRNDAAAACNVLDEDDAAVTARLRSLSRSLGKMAELDARVAPVVEQVEAALASAESAAFDLSRYADALEHDPAAVAEVQSRLDDLNRLMAKYSRDAMKSRTDPLEALLNFRRDVGEKLAKLELEDADSGTMDDAIAALEATVTDLGRELRERRQAAVTPLELGVNAQLEELGMKGAAVRVAVEPGDPGPSGADAVEFLARTNPGQAARPLRAIASGGELSRVMLALKSVVSSRDRVSVLVFDEIDANIGGRLGAVIGAKLRALSRGGDPDAPIDAAGAHQVLCITHLPQIAAYADRHFRIAKETSDGATRSGVDVLEGKPRVEELAQMITGETVTPTTRKQARELLAGAAG